MKLILILAAVILTVHSLSAGERWLNFKQKFLKSYESNIEENRRFTIFRSNLKRIEEHNAKYENGEVSYYMGITQFADMTAEEFQDMLNIQLRNRPNIQRNYADFSSAEVPDSIDWQNKGAVLSVKDQGSCGSCWAFSATGALEGQNFLVNNISTTLSEQELLDCTIIYDNYACSGGLMQHAFQYVRDKGLSSEESYPYVAYQRRCERSSTQRIVNISDYQIVSQEDLKNAVGSIGPISVAITATTSLSLYEGGIFDDPDCPFNATMLNHGVLVVGYGSEDGQDFWRIKNSWGSSWGDNGFFKIRRNPNICGLGLDNSYPIVVPNDTF